MSSIIQDARDVLAKWKRDALRGPWEYRPIAVGRAAARPEPGAPVVSVVSGAAPDIRLIVGTAGNAELLDAIDLALGYGTAMSPADGAVELAERIAAAIVAANERMDGRMTRLLATAATVLLLATLVLFSLAIWTGDARWTQTAVLALFPGVIAGVFAAISAAADEGL